MPTLTIAVLSYNRGKYLEEMVSSVLGQSQPDFKLEICDNASTDDTLERLKLFSDARMTVVTQTRNVGAVSNMNLAIERCQSDYLLVTHDDDRMKPGLVERYLSVVGEKGDVSLVSCNADQIDDGGGLVTPDSVTRYYPAFVNYETSSGGFARSYVEGLNYIICPTVMLNMRTVRASGLRFREDVGPATDSFFWCQLSYQPGRFVYLKESLYEYRLHRQQDSVLRGLESISRLRKPLYEFLLSKDRVLARSWWANSRPQAVIEWKGRSQHSSDTKWHQLVDKFDRISEHRVFSWREKLMVLGEAWSDFLGAMVFKVKKKTLSPIKRKLRKFFRRGD